MLSKPGGLIAVTVPAEIGLGSCTNEVTSNVMIRDGSTIVIGGLIQEQANQKPDRIPGLGSLPFVGKLFKNKSNETTRTELIVLITPGVIHDPDAECEGDLPRSENEHRHQNFRDNLSPIDRHNLARVEYERAARYFEEGDAERAKRHIDESLRHNQLDNDALRLRDQIAAALNDKNWFKKLRRKPPTELHRVPSAPALQSNGAVFEFEQEVLDSGSKPPRRSVGNREMDRRLAWSDRRHKPSVADRHAASFTFCRKTPTPFRSPQAAGGTSAFRENINQPSGDPLRC